MNHVDYMVQAMLAATKHRYAIRDHKKLAEKYWYKLTLHYLEKAIDELSKPHQKIRRKK